MDLDHPRTVYLLSLADDDLVMGHREMHWIGVAPSLEEDIAFAGISQDEINHADVWYQLLVEEAVEADVRAAVDALGLGREPDEYRHATLVERPPGNFADTLARHWFYDHADMVRLHVLGASSDTEVGAVARKLAHEERYHIAHADTWFHRIARSGEDTANHLHGALQRWFAEARWLFEPTPGEEDIVSSGLMPEPSFDLLDRWLTLLAPMLEDAGFDAVLSTDPVDFSEPRGRHGNHTSDWTDGVWPEMTDLHRRYAGAVW